MKCWIDIAIGNRPSETHRLTSARVTIGSGRRADISLDGVSGLLPEHFSMSPQPEGCWVELAEDASEPFTWDGRPSRGGLIPWGRDIYWGNLRVSLHAQGTAEQKSAASPVVWGALLVIPFTLFSFVYEPEQGEANGGSVLDSPPALFGGAPACSAQGPAALERGAVAQQLAYAKHSRAAFELADAVEAVHLMREATQCFLTGGREGRAAKAAEVGAAWLEKLDLTYKRALLDFELSYRAFDVDGMQSAGQELSVLLRYAGDDANALTGWLEETIRTEQARAAERAEKEGE